MPNKLTPQEIADRLDSLFVTANSIEPDCGLVDLSVDKKDIAAFKQAAAIMRRIASGEFKPVVNCSDCQYRNKVECPAYRKLSDAGEIITPPYVWFCSYGELKDGKDDSHAD